MRCNWNNSNERYRAVDDSTDAEWQEVSPVNLIMQQGDETRGLDCGELFWFG